jgi:hypothetical protein
MLPQHQPTPLADVGAVSRRVAFGVSAIATAALGLELRLRLGVVRSGFHVEQGAHPFDQGFHLERLV